MAIDALEGKTAFVTGGASGIGLGIAKALVERGARVVIADLRPDHIEDALAEFAGAAASNAVSALELDVSNREAYREAAQRMQDEFGGIDILVNNAGVGIEGPILEATYADYDFGLGVNLGGVINGFVEFLPQMLSNGRGGHIVSTASLAAEVVMPGNFAIYAAGKAAVCHYCEAVRGELGEKGIGVSVLLPGPVASRIQECKDNRPERFRDGSGFGESEEALSKREIGDDWMDPVEVGNLVCDGILADSAYIVTHGMFREAQRARAQAVLDATPDRNEAVSGFGDQR